MFYRHQSLHFLYECYLHLQLWSPLIQALIGIPVNTHHVYSCLQSFNWFCDALFAQAFYILIFSDKHIIIRLIFTTSLFISYIGTQQRSTITISDINMQPPLCTQWDSVGRFSRASLKPVKPELIGFMQSLAGRL